MSPRVDELPYEEVVTAPPAAGTPPPCTRAEVHAAFRKHLGRSYDLGALDAVLAAAAARASQATPVGPCSSAARARPRRRPWWPSPRRAR